MVNVERIARERLRDWQRDCVRDHATPALLLAIGHDERSGEIHVYIPDDPFMANNVRAWLQVAIANLP